jgi:vacuolar protein-sorting-associated protein 4
MDEPSDVQLRFERLFAVQDAELAVAMNAHGANPALFALPVRPPSKGRQPPTALLDAVFPQLRALPRAPPRLDPPRTPARKFYYPADLSPEFDSVLREVLSNLPQSPATPVLAQQHPSPSPPSQQVHQFMNQSLVEVPPSAPAASTRPSAHETAAPAPVPAQAHFHIPARPSGLAPAHPSVPAASQVPKANSLRHRLSAPSSRQQGQSEPDVYDVDADIDFEMSLARNAAGRTASETPQKRPRGPPHAQESPSFRQRGMIYNVDEGDGDMFDGNPYSAAIAAQHRERERDEHEGERDFGPFRSAASKLAADRTIRGGGAGSGWGRGSGLRAPRGSNYGQRSGGGLRDNIQSQKDGGRGRTNSYGGDDPFQGDEVSRMVTRAVLGPRRPRFSNPRSTSGGGACSGGGSGGGRKPNAAGGSSGGGGGGEELEKMRSALSEAIVTEKPNVRWGDVAGLTGAKDALKEAVILPKKFPQMFTGSRKPWKGILLYGPPGTGKSYLAKAVATESDAHFFSLSSSDLVSKWQGESEKLVKELFNMARETGNAIVFIDEIDALVSTRSDSESESSRRIKTEFLVQMDGVGNNTDGVLVLGATNIPWGLDDALLRRMERRVYIPLPDEKGREQMFKLHLGSTPHTMTDRDFAHLAAQSEGYSGSDLKTVARDAIMEPVRLSTKATHFLRVDDPEGSGGDMLMPCELDDLSGEAMDLMDISSDMLLLPPITRKHFEEALRKSRPSVGKDNLVKHEEFTREKGQEGR